MRSFCTSWSQSSWAPRLVENAFLQVALDVDVEEARDAADRHRRAVGLLDRAEIGEIGPLQRFLRIRGGLRDVAAVELRHRGEVLERANLLGQFLAHADDLVGRPHVVDLRALRVLGFEQAIDAVERDAAIVADDAAAAVGIGKAGDDAGPAAVHDFRRIGVEHAVIVGFAVLREGFVHCRIRLEAGGLQARLDHPQPAVREDRPLERLIGLKSDDDFVVAIDIARPCAPAASRASSHRLQARPSSVLPRSTAAVSPRPPWCAAMGPPGSPRRRCRA